MRRQTKRVAELRITVGLWILAVGGGEGAAQAQSAGNAIYQGFFGNTVCNNPPEGSLFRARCLETAEPTPNGPQYANISAASESSLNPNQVSAASSSALSRTEALAGETEKRLQALRGEDKGEPGAGSGKIAGFGPLSVFANVGGEWFDQSRPAFANERGFDGDRFRASIGADYRVGVATHIGAIFSYEKSSTTFDKEATTSFTPQADAGGAKSKTYSLTVFFSSSFDNDVWIDGAAGFGWSDNDFRRNATFQPNTLGPSAAPNVRAVGSASGKQTFASIGLGYDLSDGAVTFGPYVRGRYSRSTIDGYSETDLNNTGLAMKISRQTATSFAGVVGGRASYAIGTSWGVIVPQARFEYEHEFQDDPEITTTQFALDPLNRPLLVTSDAPDRNHFNAGLSLVLVLPHGISTFVDYEALVGYSNFTRHRLTGGLRLEF